MSVFPRYERARNPPLLDAAMATFALVATAEGEVSPATRHKVNEVLQSAEALKKFDSHVAINIFESFVLEIRNQPEQGRAQALQAVSAMADNDRDSRLLMQIACAVARTNGRYQLPSIARIHEIAEALGQTATDLQDRDYPSVIDKSKKATCITVGNQKGGTGKSTTAMHLAVGLLKRGQRVGCIDLDGHQGTFSHYLTNRRTYAQRSGQDIAVPRCHRIAPGEARDRVAVEQDERERFHEALAALADCDYVIVDTPGHHGHLARLGHANADILVTPLNDSFLDIDVLAEVDLDKRLVVGPSVYAKMVMQQIEQRVASGRQPMDWVVMRNRLAQLDSRNSRDMTQLLRQLSKRMGFRLQPGFSERVVFREMFYNGLIVLDLPAWSDEFAPNLSQLNARQEVCELVDAVIASQKKSGLRSWSRPPPKKDTANLEQRVADLRATVGMG